MPNLPTVAVDFTRYLKGEAYQITSRKLAAARRAVQREKDRYPLFPELLKHQTAEERLASIANEQETWWQEMRARQAQLWRKPRQALRYLPTGPRAAKTFSQSSLRRRRISPSSFS